MNKIPSRDERNDRISLGLSLVVAFVFDLGIHRGLFLLVFHLLLYHEIRNIRWSIDVPLFRVYTDVDVHCIPVYRWVPRFWLCKDGGVPVPSFLLGTIGFLSCFWFIRLIYSVIKVDWIRISPTMYCDHLSILNRTVLLFWSINLFPFAIFVTVLRVLRLFCSLSFFRFPIFNRMHAKIESSWLLDEYSDLSHSQIHKHTFPRFCFSPTPLRWYSLGFIPLTNKRRRRRKGRNHYRWESTRSAKTIMTLSEREEPIQPCTRSST